MKTACFALFLSLICACATPPEEPRGTEAPPTATRTAALGNACTTQCGSAASQCNATCDRFPRPNCEQNCDARYLNCMTACGCPLSTTYDVTVFDHDVLLSDGLCVGRLNKPGILYREYQHYTRTDHYRETLACDGTTTTTLDSSTLNAPTTCYASAGIGCTLSTHTIPGIAVCQY